MLATVENIDLAPTRTTTLTLDNLRDSAPAVFAKQPYVKTSVKYRFISTVELVQALLDAGFVISEARQSRARGERYNFARHLLRFIHPRESLQLADAIAEILFINAHDASSPYLLLAGLNRRECKNGLITRIGDFGLIHILHRGNVIADVVNGAFELIRGYAKIGEVVNAMTCTQLDAEQRRRFAQQAFALRYPADKHAPFDPELLLKPHREPDIGNDVWRTYNVVQENILRGGIEGRSALGRTTTSRAIKAIREDVRLNSALWQLAMDLIEA